MQIFIFNGKSSVIQICHNFKHIRNRNVHDLDLQNGPRSNENILIKSPYATSYLMTITFLFALYITNLEILALEIGMTLT